jgi:hypothetical protein
MEICCSAHYCETIRLSEKVSTQGSSTKMTLSSLQALTWSTVTGAVLSALLLAAGETGLPDLSRLRRGESAPRPALPAEPTGAATAIKTSSQTPPGGITQSGLSGR